MSGQQPAPTPHMNPSHPPQKGFVQKESEAYLQGAAKEAGKETVHYAADAAQDPQQAAANAQQTAANAQQQAQGLWAKYCGCLGSIA